MTPPTPPISPTEPLTPVAPTSRSPSGPQRLFKALYNPTYLAILASVGLHGLAVASLPVVGPIITGGVAKPQGPIETNIVQLTPAEAARVRSAFPAPRTTAQPPAFPYFNNSNSNSNSSSSFSPPPLSGDLSQSTRTRPDWTSIWGGNSSSADSGIYGDSSAGDSSGYYSDGNTGESDATGDEYYNYSGNTYTSGDGYAYNPDDYVDIGGIVNSPPPPPDETETPDKKKVTPPQNRQAANNGQKPDEEEVANADGTRDDRNSPDNNRISLGQIEGLRTPQATVQELEGDFRVRIVVERNGNVGWKLMEDNTVAEGAIAYTFKKLRSSVPSDPGEYELIVNYPALDSETIPDLAGKDPQTPTETPTDDPEAIALAEEFQDTYPELPIVPAPEIEIPYEAALASDAGNRARVAGIFDAEGNLVDVQLLESTGDEYLDELALNSAKVGFMPVSQATLQTIDVVFDLSGSEELPTEKPKPQPTPAPEPAAPKPQPVPEPAEESAPEPELGDKVPPKTPIEPETVEEEPTIESDPPVNPKKKPIDSRSALPSL